jgi:ABC-type branched-subunit amino acid transport system ATPase component/branched-subunit amino acid ABC-type transport system permease component
VISVQIIAFILLGLGVGAIYALVSQGLVMIYRGSGVVNFAQGAFVMVGGYAYYEFRSELHFPGALAVVGAIIVGALLGAIVHLLILRPMRNSSPIERVIATLGVLITLQAAAVLIYGVSSIEVPSALPTNTITLATGLTIGSDRLIILGIGAIVTGLLYFIYRQTRFGRLASAVAENVRVTASLGHSPDRIAGANWALGSALAALAGVLIAPISFLQPSTLSLLVIPALAAALVGQFASFPLALLASLFIGVTQSLMTLYVSTPGWTASVPFLLIILVLVARGTSLPIRSHVFDRLPPIGDGRVRRIPLIVGVAVIAVLLLFVLPPSWVMAFTVTMAFGVFCLSVMFVTGYAGQLSLAQYVLGGMGAFIAARLMASWNYPFMAAAVLAILLTAAVGLIVGLPALRTRGINLSIATLGLGIVLFSLVLSSYQWAGGEDGISVSSPTLFGWNFNSIQYPDRYGLVVLGTLTISGLAVANIRRGVVGRRMLAIQANERAAASLGVNVVGVKLYAFGLASALAGLAGILLAFLNPSIIVSQFDVMTSITVVGVVVVGGLGTVGGALMGATLLPGGVGTQLLLDLNNLQPYLPLITGLFLLYVLRTGNGLFAQNLAAARKIHGSLARQARRVRPARVPVPAAALAASTGTAAAVADGGTAPARPASGQKPGQQDAGPSTPARRSRSGLQVTDLTVRFGSVAAVNGVSFTLLPAQVHGLIGPNGAGKTTVIDALTGFVQLAAGTVTLAGTSMSGWSARRRSQAGVARSFQSLELFPDLTVRENLAVASDKGRWLPYLSDLVWPGKTVLSPVAELAVRDFRLADVLDRKPDELDFGQRRLVAIARAVASDPDVLLLDEPAAGLSDREVAELSLLIRSLAHDWGMSVLLVEHDVDLVLSVCDVVTVLDVGKVLATGKPEVIRAHPDVIEAYLGTSAPGTRQEV